MSISWIRGNCWYGCYRLLGARVLNQLLVQQKCLTLNVQFASECQNEAVLRNV
jgi:hypothetical protein